MKKIIEIEGMGCDHCIRAVKEALSGLEGVSVEDVEIGRAEVDYDPAVVTELSLHDAIRETGYTPVAKTRV